MALLNNEKTEKNTVVLTFDATGSDYETALAKSYKQNMAKIALPGFRKGKAPRKMVEQIYGPTIFYDDAVKAVYPAAYEAALTESGVEPVAQADIEITEIDDKHVVFKATITVKPEVTVKKYKGLKADKIQYGVTDEEVEAELTSLQQSNARQVPVEREAQEGDTATIDYKGILDGKAFEGGKAENYDLKLGSHVFIPGFEEQVIGHKAGEKFDIQVTFPEAYQEPTLAGKEVTFQINLKEVKETQIDKIDDEFAKDYSEFETLAELKEDVKKKIAASKEEMSNAKFDELLIDELLKSFEADVPGPMIEAEIDEMEKDFEYRVTSNGMSFDDYLKYTGMTKAQLRETFKEQATRRVNTRLALEKVAELEKIEIAQEDLDAEYERLAKLYNIDVKGIKSFIRENDLKKDLAVTRAVAIIRQSATPNLISEEEAAKKAEKPAKKTTKKAKEETKDEGEEKPAKKTTTRKKAAPKTEEKADEAEAEKKPAKKTATKPRTTKKTAKTEE